MERNGVDECTKTKEKGEVRMNQMGKGREGSLGLADKVCDRIKV